MRKGLISLMLLTVGLGSIQAKSNFTGTWKMDPAKSDLKSGPAPEARLDRITYEEPNLKDTITQSMRGRESTYDMNYSTDGTATTNLVRGNQMKSVARWEGEELVVDTKGSVAGRGVTFKDRWSISADGKTLTLQRHLNTPLGEGDQTLVFDRQ
ncbi:MAG: hypothetical protein U0Q18_29910 [Bryobacteraceae bacterium]